MRGFGCLQIQPTQVAAVPATPSSVAQAHFATEFTFEADCSDVHENLRAEADFVLLEVRSPALYVKGHVPWSINLPHGKSVQDKLDRWPETAPLVSYCASPHCHGSSRGALRLAKLGPPLKIMAGGITGRTDEGFELATSGSAA